MKKRNLVIGGFIAISLIGAVGACGDSGAINEPTKETSAPIKETKQAASSKIGDHLKVGNVIFTVNKKSTTGNVGGQFGQDAQGKFLILDVVVKNEGKEALTVDTSFFKIKSNGSEYEADATADIYANKAGQSFFLQSINPGIESKGKIVFDLPESVITSDDLTLQVQTGIFGTETSEIKLK